MPYVLDHAETIKVRPLETFDVPNPTGLVPLVDQALIARGSRTGIPEHENFFPIIARLNKGQPPFPNEEYSHDHALLPDAFSHEWGYIKGADGAVYENGGCLQQWRLPSFPVDGAYQCDRAIALVGRWGGDTWHYPMEALVGLIAVPSDWLADPTVLIHVSKINDYVRQWTEVAGIDPERLRTGVLHAKTLCVPRMGMCGAPYPAQVRWLRSIVSPIITSQSLTRGPRLLIVARRTGRRTLRNQQDVEGVCKRMARELGLGFHVHSDDALPPLAEQFRLFARADVVVVPHGGTAVLMPAMRPGSIYLDLMDLDYMNVCSMRLAYFCGVRYGACATRNAIANVRALIDIMVRVLHTQNM